MSPYPAKAAMHQLRCGSSVPAGASDQGPNVQTLHSFQMKSQQNLLVNYIWPMRESVRVTAGFLAQETKWGGRCSVFHTVTGEEDMHLGRCVPTRWYFQHHCRQAPSLPVGYSY